MRLWFDTNALFRKIAELREITDLALSKGVVPSISAQVYLERRRQVHVQILAKGGQFAPTAFEKGVMELFEVVELPLGRNVAGAWADRLAARYPTTRDWRAATLGTLGGETCAMFDTLPGRVPMTTDWWIALQAEDDDGARIVSNEGGEEWRSLCDAGRVLTWEGARAWLTALEPAEPGVGQDDPARGEQEA